MTETIIGIDLGTTNSEVAVFLSNRVEVIPIEQGKLLPSVVGIGENGEILIGQPAKNQYALYPERTVKSIKRKMGRDEQIELADQQYAPQEISAMILKRLKQIAEEYLGYAVQKAVITVPAYFSDRQRQATQEAGEIAGLDVVRMINEPTAASLVYESGCQTKKRVMVYDLGGGTFDVSVVDIENDVVEVLSSHGNNQLGGDDFDQKIVDYIVEHLSKYKVNLSNQVMARIHRAAEDAKIALSGQTSVLIEEEYLFEHRHKPVHLSLELRRDAYDEMIAPYIDETLESVHITLNSANLTVSDIDEIILVGGATRTPLISARLTQELGIQPLAKVDPDLCVATGAALQAAMIGGHQVNTVLVDVTPYTFGTDTLGEIEGDPHSYCYAPLILKNTPIPVTQSDNFYTVYEDQKTIDITVYQGEHDDALKNIPIGQYSVTGQNNKALKNPITIAFSLDVNGILKVTTTEQETGMEKTLTIENAISRFQGDELDHAKNRIEQLFDDDSAKEEDVHSTHDIDPVVRKKADQIIAQARKLMDEAPSDDQEEMIDLIERIKDALQNDNLDNLKDASESLSDIMYYLET